MRKIKRKLILSLLFILSITLLISCHRLSSHKKYIVATSPTLPPFEIITKDNQLSGFDIDIIKNIAEKTKLSIEIIPVLKDNLIYGLIDNTYDIVISGIKENSELVTKFSNISFSIPYLDIGEVLVISEDFYNFHNLNDLSNKTVAVKKGSKSIFELKKIKKIKIREYYKISNAFDDLARAKVDAIAADLPIAVQYVYYNDEYKGIFKIPKIILTKENYTIVVNSEKQDLLKHINNAITELKREGTIDKLIDKWFFK